MDCFISVNGLDQITAGATADASDARPAFFKKSLRLAIIVIRELMIYIL
jgi:hypothetical protein